MKKNFYRFKFFSSYLPIIFFNCEPENKSENKNTKFIDGDEIPKEGENSTEEEEKNKKASKDRKIRWKKEEEEEKNRRKIEE